MENQLKDIKEHESKLMEKTMEFTDRMARIESKQEHTDKKIESVGIDLKHAIDSRMDVIQTFINSQADVQNKIIEIQGKQSEQIVNIQKTLDEFTDIRRQVANHESRIQKMEDSFRSEQEIRKENTKGKWAITAAIITSITSIVVAIVTAILR